MFSTDDTIVAIATPPGRGGIGVVRISGPDAAPIASRLTRRNSAFEPRRATLTTVRSVDAGSIDRAVVTFFPSPHSYTGDNVIEISAHGSPVVLAAIQRAAMQAGARLAEPGEFTLRAYLNGRIDLVQAEAVAELIDAVTPLQARAAFDQLDGTLTARLRAIDDPLMDLIARLEASLDFPDEGYHFITPDEAAASLARIATSLDDLLELTATKRRVVVASKSDLNAAWDPALLGCDALELSAVTGEGCAALGRALVRAVDAEPLRDRAAVANARHRALLERARESVE